MSRRSKFRALVLGSMLLLGLTVVEAALRVVAPIPDPYAFHKPRSGTNPFIRSEVSPLWSATTAAEEGLPGMTGTARISVNNLGFRGGPLARPKPAGEVRVFAIGGSAIECFYLDDAACVTAVLERETGARVYGAGKSGDASDDHVAMLTQRIVHLEPDVVVVMAGANDLLGAMRGLDYLHLPREHKDRRGFSFFLKLAGTELQLGRRLHRLSERTTAQSVQSTIALRSDYAQKVRWAEEAPLTRDRPRTDPVGYGNNLRTLAGVVRAHRARLVLVTHPSTWASPIDPSARAWHWMTLKGDVRYSEQAMSDALEEMNEVARRVGAEQGVPVLDLARLLPKSLALFYDDCHWNATGAAAAGVALARFLEEERLLGR